MVTLRSCDGLSAVARTLHSAHSLLNRLRVSSLRLRLHIIRFAYARTKCLFHLIAKNDPVSWLKQASRPTSVLLTSHLGCIHNSVHVPCTLSAKAGKDSSESSDMVKLAKFNKPEDFFDWHKQVKAYATANGYEKYLKHNPSAATSTNVADPVVFEEHEEDYNKRCKVANYHLFQQPTHKVNVLTQTVYVGMTMKFPRHSPSIEIVSRRKMLR